MNDFFKFKIKSYIRNKTLKAKQYIISARDSESNKPLYLNLDLRQDPHAKYYKHLNDKYL